MPDATQPEPFALTMYGATDCDDTEHVRENLIARGVRYREVNIDLDSQAETFVIVVNAGFRSTPTLVFGEGKRKLVLTEPTDAELDSGLSWQDSEVREVQ